MTDSNRHFPNDQALIDALVNELKPVARVHLQIRVLSWLFGCAIALLALVSVVHFRGDLGAAFSSVPFVLMVLFLGCIGFVAGYLSFASAVPGRKLSKWALLPIAISVVGSAAVMLQGKAGPGIGGGLEVGLNPQGAACALTVLFWSLILGIGSILALRRLAPTRPKLSATWIAIAVASLSSIAMSVHCPVDNSLHILIWHFLLPFSTIVTIARVLALRLLRW